MSSKPLVKPLVTSTTQLFSSVLNRTGLITYNKIDGVGRIEITSTIHNEETKKYEFICVFTGDMHFYKGTFDSSFQNKELFIKGIKVSTKKIDSSKLFLPEKRYSIAVEYLENNQTKYINFGFYRRYKNTEKDTGNIVCNFVQTTLTTQQTSVVVEEPI